MIKHIYAVFQSIFGNKLIRYLISGGTAAVVNLGLVYLFVSVLHLWYIAGTTLAFIGAFVVSFLMQKFITFADRSLERASRQLTIYFLVALCNLGINTLLMYAAVDGLGIEYLLAQFIVTALIAGYSFFLYKYLIFMPSPSLKE